MDSKKLQALQQANSHLAPMPQTKAPTFQHGDFRPSRSPVFQNYPQYQSLASNFAHINMTNNPQDHQQQQQQIHSKATFQQHQSNAQLGYHDQIYQSTNGEKIYHHQARGGGGQFPGVHQHVHSTSARLQQQFQALEQEKIQAQMRTQNEALMQQQQTFALRQQLNPPVPSYPLQSQTSSMSNMSSINNVPLQLQQQMLQNNRTLPPSSLNLTNQYQPAQGPMKLNNPMQQQQIMMLQNERQLVQQRQLQAVQQQMYVQHMQMQKQMVQQNQQTPTEVPMIQQNIPGQVVNQSVQTQISGSGMKTKSPETPVTTPSTPATPSTPTHSALERKKSEPVHTLKSPVAKRHPNAPVSLSGWLWKQGSEGLKVWRKRWFVLSEYCLFYYRGPEEEKIMGSVLLPSYRISACSIDDKANRKYAFKCEHTNMRTYVLAAENPDSMGQWVKALMQAALMQGSSESESQPSISSSFIPSGASAGDNSDSGIHTFQSQQSKMSGVPQGPVTPASDNSGQHHQPLYANAPPKPRRVTDCGYSSPSPENAVDQYGHLRMRTDPIYGYKTPVSSSRSATKTPDPILSMRMQQMRIDQNKSPSALKSQPGTYPYPSDQRSAMEQEQYMQKLMLHQQQLQQQQKYLANTIPMSYNNSERRTPDTYGPPRGVSAERRTFGDYEDIYQLGKNSQVMPQVAQSQQPSVDAGTYRRPVSPTKYDGNMQIPPMPQRYTPNFLEQQQQQQQPPQQVHMRSKPAPSVARPHSADFLEYEARNPITTRMKAEPAQAPRPKSSLDINRGQDNSYYSESSYAEKMRQSALYLQKQSQAMPNKAQDSSFFQQQSGKLLTIDFNSFAINLILHRNASVDEFTNSSA
jgi:PH domain